MPKMRTWYRSVRGGIRVASWLILVSTGVFVQAGELPANPGPHIEGINALGDDSWLELGAPAPDPVWGRARGRKWTSKMPYAEDLGGAFLFGEGVHGWRDPGTGRYMDDLWFYDVLSHRWLNLYPGFDTLNPPPVTLNADGFTSVSGEPVPIATMVHGYDATAWDPDSRRFMSMPSPGAYWGKAIPSVWSLLQKNPKAENKGRASPWFFDIGSRKWDRRKTPWPSPRTGFGDTLIYVPDQKRVFFRRKGEVWFYDVEQNTWTQVRPSGPNPPFGIEANSCLDQKRGHIYLGGGKFPVASGPNALWIYDLKTDRWVDPKPEGTPGDNNFGPNEALLHCDTASDVIVLIRPKGGSRGVHVYDPGTNAWSSMASGMPEGLAVSHDNSAVSGFYDAKLNVHLLHVAGDSRDNGRIFAYRYAR